VQDSIRDRDGKRNTSITTCSSSLARLTKGSDTKSAGQHTVISLVLRHPGRYALTFKVREVWDLARVRPTAWRETGAVYTGHLLQASGMKVSTWRLLARKGRVPRLQRRQVFPLNLKLYRKNQQSSLNTFVNLRLWCERIKRDHDFLDFLCKNLKVSRFWSICTSFGKKSSLLPSPRTCI